MDNARISERVTAIPGRRLVRILCAAAIVGVISSLTACRGGPRHDDRRPATPGGQTSQPDTSSALVAPNHAMLFGYFYADGKYGDDLDAVSSHTNVYVACPECYDTATDFTPSLRAALASPAVAAKAIVVVAGDPERWDQLLDALTPVWPRVRWVEVAHEARIRREAMETRIRDWHARVARRGLAKKPVAAMQDLCQTWQLLRCAFFDGWTSPLVDLVGIEAYLPIPDSGPQPGTLPWAVDYDPVHVTENLTSILTRAEARISEQQQIYVAVMAYDRNGEWKDAATLPVIARATYEWARTRSRVTALLPFAYGRPGGAESYPDLEAALADIGGTILRGPAQ